MGGGGGRLRAPLLFCVGIFDEGFVWPGEPIVPDDIVDPIDYNSGTCGMVDEIWSDALWYGVPHLGETLTEPTLQADGSVLAWVYSWIYAEAHSVTAYVTPELGVQLSGPTYSSIGGWNFIRRGLQWVSLEWPVGSSKKYKFAWGANPADIAFAGAHSYFQIVADLYGCSAQNNEGLSLGFWHTPSESDTIVRAWQSGYISDCFFMAVIRVYADLFFFPLPFFEGQGGIAPVFGGIISLLGGAPAGGVIAVAQSEVTSTLQRLKKKRVI